MIPADNGAPNAAFRAVRIYGSDSMWGDQPSRAVAVPPIEIQDFPELDCRALVFVGSVPDEIRKQIRVRDAVLDATMASMVEPRRPFDDSVRARLDYLPPRAFEDKDWYVTLVFDKTTYVPESPVSGGSEYRWWHQASAEAQDQPFRIEAEQVLDVLAVHTSFVIGPELFEERVTDPDISMLLGNDRPVSVVPKLSGSISRGMGRPWLSIPQEELQERLGGLSHQALGDHALLRRAVAWYVTALSTSDPWREFQAQWLALELLTHKLANRYREEVLGQVTLSTTEASSAVREMMWSEDRAPLIAKFAVVALALDPENADADLETFKIAKLKRDAVSHGTITSAEDLPIAATTILIRKYLDRALCSLRS